MNDQTKCETKLLDDLPAESDAFATDGDTGPHERVANAIADMIESAEMGGKAIGLEGSWGSGKSTVVRFLSNRFSKNDDYTVVLFDAWAHEGDPLRRTFIESVVTELREYGWADKEVWKEKLEELANRRKKTKTLITPHATWFGILAALSLLLIPMGLAFTNAGFRQGVTLNLNQPVNWLFTIGLLLVLSPFWIIVARIIHVKIFLRECPKLSDFAFLTNEAVSETHTETIETSEPTSLEFDKYFGALMHEALSGQNSRRLLLVLDNLDRVDAEAARSIWGTLQTFLHDRDHNSEEWYKQLWVLVPYDPMRISKLWNQPKEKGEDGTSESFLDKSFQVRFHVAPPVLSDWKLFLSNLVEQSLPSHAEDQHMIYRVYDHSREASDAPPTPRELKLYINQIGAIHRQWQHEFPISHVAFFVLARKKHPRLIDELRQEDFPSEDDSRLLRDDLIGSLAGLAFNVKATKGMELLLADSISEALKSTESDDLKKIAERNGAGFWAVLETVATTRWHDEDAQVISKIASQLRESELLESHEGPEKSNILNALRDAAKKLETWMPVSDGVGAGMSDLLALQDSQAFSANILKKFCRQLSGVDLAKRGAPNFDTVVKSLFKIFDTAKSLGHDESIPKPTILPFKGEQWITACSDIATHDNDKIYWKNLRAGGKPEEVSASFLTSVSGGTFSESDVIAVEITHKSATKCDWQDFCTAIKNRLSANQNPTADECIHLLSALLQLKAVRVKAAISAQKELCESGHLLHHFYQAMSQNDYAAQAALIFSFAGQHPDLAKPTDVGNSAAGYTQLVATVDAPDQEVVTELYGLTERLALLPEVLRIIQNANKPHALFVEVLKRVADSESPEVVFASEVIKEHWQSLRLQLNDKTDTSRFQKLVGLLAKSNGLCEFLQGSENEFDPESMSLYLDILRGANDSVPSFIEWCRDGLQEMSKEDWAVDLTGRYASCAVCLELSEQSQLPVLANNFTDSLQDHAQLVIQGKNIPPEWIVKEWAIIVGCIDQSSGTAEILRERLIDIVVSADGKISSEFFKMYGHEIEGSSMLAAHDRVLSHFFTTLVRDKHQQGLEWLGKFSTENPDFLGKIKKKPTVEEFKSRLQGLVDNQNDAEYSDIINSIAGHFGIEPASEREDSKTLEES